jgi:hypothetical protein
MQLHKFIVIDAQLQTENKFTSNNISCRWKWHCNGHIYGPVQQMSAKLQDRSTILYLLSIHGP